MTLEQRLIEAAGRLSIPRERVELFSESDSLTQAVWGTPLYGCTWIEDNKYGITVMGWRESLKRRAFCIALHELGHFACGHTKADDKLSANALYSTEVEAWKWAHNNCPKHLLPILKSERDFALKCYRDYLGNRLTVK